MEDKVLVGADGDFSKLYKELSDMVHKDPPQGRPLEVVEVDKDRPHNNPTKCGIGQWVTSVHTGKIAQVESIHIKAVHWLTEYHLSDGSKLTEIEVMPISQQMFSAYMAAKTLKDQLTSIQDTWGFKL